MEEIEISFNADGIDEKELQAAIDTVKKDYPDFNIKIDNDRCKNFDASIINTLVIEGAKALTVDNIAKAIAILSGLANITSFLEKRQVNIFIPSKDIYMENVTLKNAINKLLSIFNPQKPA